MKLHIKRHIHTAEAHQKDCSWIGVYEFIEIDYKNKLIVFYDREFRTRLSIENFEYSIEPDVLQDMSELVDPVDYSKYKL